jgi:magnesium chelatase accessory protein
VALPPDDWPARTHSRAVAAGGLDWHVQLAGRGPVLLLLHGSGGASHSFAPMLPALAAHANVVVPDLPGHGFTRGAAFDRLTLPALREALAALLAALRLEAPALVAGHSAGAALALRWSLDAPVPPLALLGFAPSLVAPPPRYGQWLAPVLHPIATSAPVTSLLARVAGPTGLIDGLLASTGSTLPPAQRAAYRRLFADPAHVRGAMSFMAAADLPALLPACGALPCAVNLVLGERDRWIPPRPLGAVIARHLPQAVVEHWPGGHLLHEEDPARAAARVLAALAANER